MIHSFTKLISKILALRLAPRLNVSVAKNQNAFIRDRSIHDNFKYIQWAVVLMEEEDPHATPETRHIQSLQHTFLGIPATCSASSRIWWNMAQVDHNSSQYYLFSDPPKWTSRVSNQAP